MSSKTKHFLLWLAVVTVTAAGLVWFLNVRKDAPKIPGIPVSAAIERINNREVRELHFKTSGTDWKLSSTELVAIDGSITHIEGLDDVTREELLTTIFRLNDNNIGRRISVKEEMVE